MAFVNINIIIIIITTRIIPGMTHEALLGYGLRLGVSPFLVSKLEFDTLWLCHHSQNIRAPSKDLV